MKLIKVLLLNDRARDAFPRFVFFNAKKIFAYLSVVLFTNSPFQRPHVNSRAVTAKNRRFTAKSTPTGPKKYARISMSPAK